MEKHHTTLTPSAVADDAVAASPLRLFSALGVELEYMIVDRETLAVQPYADRVLLDEAGEVTNEIDFPADNASWSNELALHVLEFKVTRPINSLDGAADMFHRQAVEANKRLERLGAKLMGAATHPWFDPSREFKTWPHGNRKIYSTFDRIFDCRGHGWSNLQSMHLNFPFGDASEFKRLHAALRLIIPLTPALAASSPYMGGKFTGLLDARLNVYRANAARVPSISGQVVPEPIATPEQYQAEILERIYRDIAPHDPEGILRDEWLNARGCIARFQRDAIELRTLDIQECPRADIAIAALIQETVRQLVSEKYSDADAQLALSTESLHELLLACIRDGENALVSDRRFLDCLGLGHLNRHSLGHGACRAGEIWEALAGRAKLKTAFRQPLSRIFSAGTLATRLHKRCGDAPTREALFAAAKELCACLAENQQLS